MESVEWRDDGRPCPTFLGENRCERARKRRLARAWRAGDAEEEPPGCSVDRGEQLVREVSDDLVRVAPRRCSRRPRD
jgi:hypothetical protein